MNQQIFTRFQIMTGSMSFDNLSSLSLMRTSESFSDLNAELSGASSASRATGRSTLSSLRSAAGGPAGVINSCNNATAAPGAEEFNNNKPFGLGEHNV